MEPMRGQAPGDGFLSGIRDIATGIGAVLIFDEVTSGFRMNCGGVHLTLGIDPDIAVFGKALGNGFPITAVLGKKAFMDAAQDTFISSTYWTERIGFTAALATLKKMKQFQVPDALMKNGEMIASGLKSIAEETKIQLKISGMVPLLHMDFAYEDGLAMQTFYAQEMLKRGFLVGAAIYSTYAYTPEIIDMFLRATKEVFVQLHKIKANCEKTDSYLSGPVKHSGFKRLA
jgi:glutamate-1-semialdehyde aminotransferase